MATTYPALTHLARGYFHQDWVFDHDDDQNAVLDHFLRSEPESSRVVGAEVARALTDYVTEQETRAFVLEELDSSYLVEADGLTYRGWLQSIADRARELGY